MLTYIENLSVTEAENVKKTIQDLLKQTCILQVKCDPVTLVQRDNPRYQVCMNHREFLTDYLAVLGCELIHDTQENIFRIAGEGVITEKLNLLTTKLMLLLKVIYRDKIMGEGLNATVTTLAEIRRYGVETNLISEKILSSQLHESLSLLKRHQMIELPSAIGNLEDHSPIYLYSTINILCPTAEINVLVNEYAGETDDSQQRISEEENMTETKEDTDEENIY
ncbi:MAG: DUF4194 domain-containing protein [Clostridium sp.]|nr:DUF4194 domain-containing protein [Clostridium sp.]